MRRLLGSLTPSDASKPLLDDPEEYASKVAKYTDFVLGRGIWVYKRNCLKRSLILYHFMRRTGIDVQLCLGVKTNQISETLRTSNNLNGHAWLVLNGQPWQEHESIATETYTVTYRFPEIEPTTDNGARPEIALFLACARSSFDPAASQTITQLLQRPIDWPRFLELVRHHGLLGYAYTALAPQVDAVPEAIRATLRTDCQNFTARAMLLSAELARLTQRLSESGIKVIAYKGPALAQTLYGSTGKRHFNDLDVLINKPDLSRARENLLAQGYRSRLELEWEHSFVRDDLNIMADVHWAFAHQSLQFNLPFDDVWQRRRMVTVGGKSVATLGKEDTLIVQCINAAKDDWASLGQIFEIGLMTCAHDLDWEVLFERVEAVGCKRIVLLGASLASQLFAMPIPVAAAETLEKDKSVQKLSVETAARLIQPTAAGRKIMHVDRLRARSRERLRERIPHYRRMLRHIVMPNEKDREFLPLPHLLTPLYFIIRPIRLTHKHASTIFRSGKKGTGRESGIVSR